MDKYIRVYSDSFNGQVFTENAFNIMKEQLCNGNPAFYEIKEIGVTEIGENETVNDVDDLPALGFTVPNTEQSDDCLIQYAEENGHFDDETNPDYEVGNDDDEGYF